MRAQCNTDGVVLHCSTRQERCLGYTHNAFVFNTHKASRQARVRSHNGEAPTGTGHGTRRHAALKCMPQLRHDTTQGETHTPAGGGNQKAMPVMMALRNMMVITGLLSSRCTHPKRHKQQECQGSHIRRSIQKQGSLDTQSCLSLATTRRPHTQNKGRWYTAVGNQAAT
jgi:hypothetical protein